MPTKNDKLGADRDERTDQRMRYRSYNQRRRGGTQLMQQEKGDRYLLAFRCRLAGLTTDRAGHAAAGVPFFGCAADVRFFGRAAVTVCEFVRA